MRRAGGCTTVLQAVNALAADVPAHRSTTIRAQLPQPRLRERRDGLCLLSPSSPHRLPACRLRRHRREVRRQIAITSRLGPTGAPTYSKFERARSDCPAVARPRRWLSSSFPGHLCGCNLRLKRKRASPTTSTLWLQILADKVLPLRWGDRDRTSEAAFHSRLRRPQDSAKVTTTFYIYSLPGAQARGQRTVHGARVDSIIRSLTLASE
ncbi:hypothetical protein V8E36_000226 [Tilletia maclaganii]